MARDAGLRAAYDPTRGYLQSKGRASHVRVRADVWSGNPLRSRPALTPEDTDPDVAGGYIYCRSLQRPRD